MRTETSLAQIFYSTSYNWNQRVCETIKMCFTYKLDACEYRNFRTVKPQNIKRNSQCYFIKIFADYAIICMVCAEGFTVHKYIWRVPYIVTKYK